MLFTSIDFVVFLPLVFAIYWLIPKNQLPTQNIFITLASFVFYGWWDIRFLVLMLISIVIDFFCGRWIHNAAFKNRKKFFLALSIVSNLSMLGFFKYYNFFIESFNAAFSIAGIPLQGTTLDIILPVGISFYTFQTLSYTIDIYRGILKPVSSFSAFSAFVSFFPQLVAGPIEKAASLLPQFQKVKQFDYGLAILGCKQILWGFFKKCVIADNCAVVSDAIFNNHDTYGGSTLLLGAIFFSFQIYGDFSGYTDMAIGTARLFGISLSRNFNYPYFSKNLIEFWRKWHISLTSWFRDYVYIPLGGNRVRLSRHLMNIMVVFLLSGFWHGASWNFIAWGGLHGIFILLLTLRNVGNTSASMSTGLSHYNILKFFQILITFILVSLLWVFFRADNITDALSFLMKISSASLLELPALPHRGISACVSLLIFFMLALEWRYRYTTFPLESAFSNYPGFWRWSFYIVLIGITGLCMHTGHSPFIYFQF